MSAITQYAPDQLDLIKRTVAHGATNDELQLYLYDCQRVGVHPLDKLLHFTKRKGRYVPITSIDLMRSRAADTGEMVGSDDAIFLPGHGDRPDSATVTVYRVTSDIVGKYTATARWNEYYPGDGEPGFMWRKMPYVMLAKCAEALALRKAFPKQLAGLYAREEMDQADAPVQRAAPKPGPMVITRALTGEVTIPATTPTPDAAVCDSPQQEPVNRPAATPGVGGLSLLDMAREAARQGNRFYYGAFWDMRSAAEKKQIAAIRDELNALMKQADDQAENQQDAI